MAWIFALNAECGGRETHARDLARHFEGWPSRIFTANGGWWCGVAPEGVGERGVESDEDATAVTAAGQPSSTGSSGPRHRSTATPSPVRRRTSCAATTSSWPRT